jgi:katanin p80 WD40 repeat-containing subunit B1
VCAGSAAGAVKVWDLEAARMVRTLTGHRAGIKALDFHPYGDFLATGSTDTNMKVNLHTFHYYVFFTHQIPSLSS